MQSRHNVLRAALLLGFATSPAVYGQSHELGILAGATNPSAQVDILSAVSVSAGTSVSVQVDYAYRLKSTPGGKLYLEFPATRVAKASVGIQWNRVAAGQSKFFFTPGVRYRFLPASRVSPYVAGGFGFGWFDKTNIVISPPILVEVADGMRPAFGFGGGAALRIYRGLSFRAEVRDFVGCGAGTERNHVVYQRGFGVRF